MAEGIIDEFEKVAEGKRPKINRRTSRASALGRCAHITGSGRMCGNPAATTNHGDPRCERHIGAERFDGEF